MSYIPFHCQTPNKILDVCIMSLLRLNLLRLDTLHYALLVAIVLLAVYVFGSFREGLQCVGQTKAKCNQKNCKWFTNTSQLLPGLSSALPVGFNMPGFVLVQIGTQLYL